VLIVEICLLALAIASLIVLNFIIFLVAIGIFTGIFFAFDLKDLLKILKKINEKDKQRRSKII
jgi:hypothetical protein